MSTLEPITRNEKFYKAIADNDSTGLPEPKTREELYLNAIATGNKEGLPEPVTRQEIFLREIAENGGGGDVTIEPLTVTENGTYTAPEGKAYTPVVVNVPTPDDSYQLKSLPIGAISTITDGSNLPLASLKVGIEPIQDLHGYDNPWVGGAGKNKFNKSTVNVDKYIGADGQLTTSQYNQDVTDYIPVTSGQSYIINSSININNYSCFYDENKNVIGSVFANNQFPKVAPSDAKYIRVTFTNADINIFMFEQGTTASSTYYPYSNICPISGWDEANIVVSPTTDAEDGTTYTIQFKDGDNPLTVYGGSLDVISGVLTVDKGYIASYNGETLPSTWISDRDVYVEGTSPTTGAQVVYELATPQTYQLNPTAVKSLLGSNNVWADTGDVLEGSYFKEL